MIELEKIERDAIADQFRAAPAELRAKLILGWSEIDGALVTRLERVDNGWYNRAVGLGVEKPTTQKALQSIASGFRAAGSKSFTIELAPFAQPPELRGWLAELAMAPSARWSKLVRDGALVDVPHDLARRVDVKDALTFGRVSCAGWGQPPPLAPWIAALVGRDRWRAYLAWDRGEPIGAGLLYVDGEFAWLGGDATLVAHRKKGAQSQLIAQRILDARELGARTLVAETIENGGSFRNAEKLGFRVAYVRESFNQTASK